MLKKRKTGWKATGVLSMLFAMLIFTAGTAVCEDALNVDDDENWCLDDITNYTPGRGPFNVKRDISGMVKMWVPEIPSGCKVPIVHLANGTFGMCAAYAPILQNLAAYGFLAACYESMNTGQGTQAITAIETAMRRHGDIADTAKIGFMGHSQGGCATFTGLYRAEQKWGMSKTFSGLAMQPASGFGNVPLNWVNMYRNIQSPMSMFNGTYDTLVSAAWVREAYNLLPRDNFKVWYTATGLDSTHIPTPNEPTREMSIPWFRWTLLGDADACQAFNDLPNKMDWRRAESANVPSCY